MDWRAPLEHDPVPHLLASSEEPIRFFTRRDLLGEKGLTKEGLWLLPEVCSLMRSQRPDGSWLYKGKRGSEDLGENYEYLETYRNLAILVDCYSLTKDHPTAVRAVEYLLSLQTDEGDIRSIYGEQYSPNYTAASLEMMVKAGYEEDPRVRRGYDWLLNIRMDDGGWAIPMRTAGVRTLREGVLKGPIAPVLSKPSSHWCTGIVLRALAVHPRWRRSVEAVEAAMLLKSRMFKADSYTDRRAPSFWIGFSYPFWYTDIVSTLDTLSRLEMPFDDPDVRKAMTFMKALQQDDGSFQLRLLRSGRADGQRWVSLAFCRALRRFHGHLLLED